MCASDLALRNEHEGKCEYLMKFENQDALGTNSRVQTPEINGQLTSDNDEQNDESTTNTDQETGLENKDSLELENLKYAFIFSVSRDTH